MADFPGSIFDPRTKAERPGTIYDASKTTIGYAQDVQELDAEVVAIETELGTDPAGDDATVKARLERLENSKYTLFTNKSVKATAYSLTEVSILPAGVGSLDIPAGWFVEGRTLFFRLMGYHNIATPPEWEQFKVKLDANVLLDSGTFNNGATTNKYFELYGQIMCRGVDDNGPFWAQGLIHAPTNAAPQTHLIPLLNTSQASFDKTVELTFDITLKTRGNPVATVVTITNFTLEALMGQN